MVRSSRHDVGSPHEREYIPAFQKTASESEMILRSVAIYGTASDRRYAAVWHTNAGYMKCHAREGAAGSVPWVILG
jgi:hypothetical protein